MIQKAHNRVLFRCDRKYIILFSIRQFKKGDDTMATHNQVRVVGYVLGNTKIVGTADNEKVFFTIRTVHRDVDLYQGEMFEDIMVFYDGASEQLMNRIKKLEPFDIVDIKGVFNILTMNKTSYCPHCGKQNIKYYSSTTFVYPIHIQKLNALYQAYEYDEKLPEELLVKHYKEISNQAIICGTVVKEPELKELKAYRLLSISAGCESEILYQITGRDYRRLPIHLYVWATGRR